jgi:hypothetical protein
MIVSELGLKIVLKRSEKVYDTYLAFKAKKLLKGVFGVVIYDNEKISQGQGAGQKCKINFFDFLLCFKFPKITFSFNSIQIIFHKRLIKNPLNE